MRTAYRLVGALAVVLALGAGALVLLALLGRAVLGGETGSTTGSATPGDGVVRVVGVSDGDTLRVRVDGVTERLRIIGIDAPELRGDECLAQEAASRMQSLVQSRSVRIVSDPTQGDRDAYGRILRHVRLLDGRSVGLELLSAGLATEYTYGKPYLGVEEHRAAEAQARAAGLGVWGEVCTEGAAVLPTGPPQGAGDDCAIKGNIAADGERIYHVPGQRHYEETVIDPTRGERWFCTPEQARDAGWRPART